MSAVESRHRRRNPPSRAVSCRQPSAASRLTSPLVVGLRRDIVTHRPDNVQFCSQLLVNGFGVFGAFYRCHFSHDFRAQGVTLGSKALATKCIFQI